MPALDPTRHIGGYFELELPRGSGPLHSDALAFTTARAGLAAILQHVRPTRLHLPFYICDAVLQPLRATGVEPVFYRLDEHLRPARLPAPRAGELVLAVNYFGLQTDLMKALARRYRSSLIVDHTQAFFQKPAAGAWTLYSARKFFGVPDGAYLYAPEAIDVDRSKRAQPSIAHLVSRALGRQLTGYRQVRAHEKRFDASIRNMSSISERILSSVDYAAARRQRRANYQALHRIFGAVNGLHARLPADAAPMAYPLLLRKAADRAVIARARLYVPTLWPEVATRAGGGFSFERSLVGRLLPLPIDHRYDVSDMLDVAERLRRALGKAIS